MPLRINPALYYLLSDGILKGMRGGYVDDFIRSVDSDFFNLSQKIKQKFGMKDESAMPFDFTRCLIRKKKGGMNPVDQSGYLRRFEFLLEDSSYFNFWLT